MRLAFLSNAGPAELSGTCVNNLGLCPFPVNDGGPPHAPPHPPHPPTPQNETSDGLAWILSAGIKSPRKVKCRITYGAHGHPSSSFFLLILTFSAVTYPVIIFLGFARVRY